MDGVAVNKNFNVTSKQLVELVDERDQGLTLIHSKYGGLEGLAKTLNVDVSVGLNGSEVADRKAVFGSNEIKLKPPKSFLELVWEAFQDPTLILLIICSILITTIALVEAAVEGKPALESDWVEGMAIFVTVLIVVSVAAGTDYAKNKQFMALSDMASDIKLNVQREGKTQKISIFDLVVGDILWVGYGDMMPADGVLLESQELKADESALTGEPILIAKDTVKKPFLLSGTMIMEGSGKMLVLCVGESSQAGQIKQLAAGENQIKGWKTIDGTVNVTNGSALVNYNALHDSLKKIVSKGMKVKIVNGADSTEYTIAEKGTFSNTQFTLDRPYEGVNAMTLQLDFMPTEEEEETSVLQGKLELLAGFIGQAGTVMAIIVFLGMLIEFLVKWFYFHDEAIGWTPTAPFHWEVIVKCITTAVTILVVAIPEGLPLAVTLSLAFSVKKMLADMNLVKHLDACETMGSATTICSDKTGTLTTNRMTVMKGYMGKKYFDRAPRDGFSQAAVDIMAQCISLNSGKTTNVRENASGSGPREYLGNKTECGLLNMLLDMKVDYGKIRDTASYNYPSGTKLFPFNSGLKRMSIVVPVDGGKRLFTKGASEIVLELCTNQLMADGSIAPLTAQERATINTDIIEKFADDGYRTLSLAYKDIRKSSVETDWANADQEKSETGLTLICIVGIEDPLREEVPGAIAQCNRAGIVVRMVTGDNVRTARSIAKKCNILPDTKTDPDRFLVMEGPEFRKKVLDSSGNLLQGEFDKIWPRLRVLARSSPKDKYTLITGLLSSELHKAKLKGDLDGHIDYTFVGNDRQVIAVTGDGTNDAPALAKADVGFAMGILGTEVAKDACDIVLLDDNFSSIVKAVMWGRNVYDSIGKFLQFQLTVNVVAVTVATVGALSNGESPLTSVQLLWVNMIMDSLGSLALATEPPTPALLERKPHGRNEPVLNPTMIKNVLVGSVYQLAITFFLLYGQMAQPTMFMDYGAKTAITECNQGGSMTNKTIPLFEQCQDEEFTGLATLCDYNPSSPYGECVKTVRNTILFNSFVFMQIFNEINARKLYDELNVFEGIHRNPIFICIEIITIGLQILLVTFFGKVFSVRALNLNQWGISVAFGAGMLPWGLVMHSIKPCVRRADETAHGPTDTVIAGASDDVIRESSSIMAGGSRASKRLESASSNYRIPTQTSSRVLSQARRTSTAAKAFTDAVGKGNVTSAAPSVGLLS